MRFPILEAAVLLLRLLVKADCRRRTLEIKVQAVLLAPTLHPLLPRLRARRRRFPSLPRRLSPRLRRPPLLWLSALFQAPRPPRPHHEPRAPAMAVGSSTVLNLDSYEVVNRQIRHSPNQQKRRLASVAALSLVLAIVTVSCLSGQRNTATALASSSANSDEAVINSIEDRLDSLEVADHRLKKKLARLQDAFDKFSPVPGPRGLPGQDGAFVWFLFTPALSSLIPSFIS